MAIPKLALIPSGFKAGKLYSVLPTNGDGDFTTTRNTVATRVNENGLIEEVASNVPRLDYSDGGCPSLLLEPFSRNLIQYSESFDNAYWNKNGLLSVTSGFSSPSGDTSAFKLVEDTSNGNHQLFRNNINTGNGKSTISIKAKANGRNWIHIKDTEQNEGVYFDLSNGTVGTIVGSPDAYSITALSNGWYDLTLTTTSATRVDFQVYLAISDNDIGYQGNGTSGIYIWGAQLEFLSYATSYIISNSGATTTRAADTANGAGNSTVINSSEGTLYFEGSALFNGGDNKYISLSDNTTSNRIQLVLTSTANRISVIGGNGSVSGAFTAIISNSHNQTDNNKVAFKYSSSGVKVFINGIEIGSNTDNISWTSGTFTTLDFALWNQSSAPFYGKVKSLQVYTTALTDAELTTLTTI